MNRTESLHTQILKLKHKKKALILAHYYQESAIQEVADFVGDSLELAQKAATTNTEIIVFAGVRFMAETAKIINPDKKVLLPDLEAGCSLADVCEVRDFKAFLEKYPNHVVVTYINSHVEIKAISDYVCTSSNAAKVIRSIPKGKSIVFGPDKNLGKYLMQITGRPLVLWGGSCIVHEAFSIDKLLDIHKKHPNAKIIAHPECEPHLLKVADFIGSTSRLIKYVQNSPAEEFIVATEAGILHQMEKAAPDKKLIPVPTHEDTSCACGECAYMKVNTLQKVYDCLLREQPEINLPSYIRLAAYRPIRRMLDCG